MLTRGGYVKGWESPRAFAEFVVLLLSALVVAVAFVALFGWTIGIWGA